MALFGKTAQSVAATWVNRMSGGAGLVLYAYLLYRAAHGTPTPPTDELAMLGYVALIVFILSGWAVIQHDRNRADGAQQRIRDLQRAEEHKQFMTGGPTGLKIGQIMRWAWEARTPDRLDEPSSTLLAQMTDHAIAGLNRDTIYIIQRERFNSSFGPFVGRRGRYGALTWKDANSEAKQLISRGIAEKIPEDPIGRLRWTALGYAVMGKLGPRLDWWR